MTACITNPTDRDSNGWSGNRRHSARRTLVHRPYARTLCRFDDGAAFAYRCGRDFFRSRDNTLWSHESDGLLLSARSCTPLLLRIGNVYFDLTDHRPLYYERATMTHKPAYHEPSTIALPKPSLPIFVANERRPHPRRLLFRFDDDEPFAYAHGHELIRCRDQMIWAHLRDGQLVSARSGAPLAYQERSIFYDAVTHQPLYFESS
jgi:hypothetical protein